MNERRALVSSLLAALWVLLLTPLALGAQLRTQISAQRVGVGQTVVVQVTVPVGDGPEPSNPQLPVRGAADVQGPSVQSQRSIVMHNFDVRSETNVVYTWRIRPQKTGTLRLGPAQVQVGNATVNGEPVEVEVVDGAPAPQTRRRGLFGRDPFGSDPFDIFGTSPFGGDPLGQGPDRRDPFDRFSNLREAPSEWLVPHAADPVAFLHAVLDKRQVVLGEPVRLTVLAFGSRGEFFEQSQQSPSLSDFVSFPVLQDQMDEPLYRTTLDGQQFLVRKIREYILVPLSTGTLTIGSMSSVLQSRMGSYPATASHNGMEVSTLPLQLRVVDAPDKGRPAGYFPGDVGRYRLSAEVRPRQVAQGEYLSVLLTIEGEGYIPSKVLLPESKHVQWNAPSVRGEPEVKNGVLGGARTLEFAAQVKEPGHLQLGTVSLPYYDAERARYQVARVDLGEVEVAPNRATPVTAAAEELGDEPAAGAGSFRPRTQLGPLVAPPPALPTWSWWTLLGVPVATFFTRALGKLGAVLLARRTLQKEAGPKGHLEEARSLFVQGRKPEALATLERALLAAIFESTGVRARGVLKAHLAAELSAAGLGSELATECGDLLNELEHRRYSPEANTSDSLRSEVERVVALLSKERVPGKEPRR